MKLGYLFKEGVKNAWSNRTMTIASIAVLVSCLLLTGSAVLFSMNLAKAMEVFQGGNSIQVYLDEGLPTLESVKIGEAIKSIDNVENCEFVSKDEAVQSYIDALGGDGDILAGLTGENNPLPDAFSISLKDLSIYEETAQQILSIEGVQKINDYSEVANKLTRLDTMVKIVAISVVTVLGIVSLFIIANTIRVTMHSRRLEISIMKSVGATNGFVRVPFLVEGALIGCISGLISSGLVALAYNYVMKVISSLMSSFIPLPLSTVIPWTLLAFVGAGILFGLVGGLISIGKYLNKEGSKVIAL